MEFLKSKKMIVILVAMALCTVIIIFAPPEYKISGAGIIGGMASVYIGGQSVVDKNIVANLPAYLDDIVNRLMYRISLNHEPKNKQS